MAYRLKLAQKITVVKNVWDLSRVDGPAPVPVGRIRQARMKLKERVICTTPDGTATLFTVHGRNMLEIRGTYEVADAAGNVLAVITKDFRASLGRSTYVVESSAGTWKVTETNPTLAVLRRIVNVVVDIPWLLPIQFSILDAGGNSVGCINRVVLRIRDTYDIAVTDDRLDQRVAAAVGVAVDAFMNR